jgi:type II secretory pathway pseudopilin PulG
MTRKFTTGFTLTEVMFAVITLGIGLIMIAAVFPVAIQQRKLTGEETTAAGSAATGMQVMAQIGAIPGTLPPNGNVVQALPATTWQLVRGNLVSTTDPRVAWVPLYRRAAGDPNAQVFVIGVQVRNASNFTSADVLGTPANLEPRPVKATIVDGAAGVVDTITFNPGASTKEAAAGDGAFVVIANDSGNGGWMNGRIYRLGVATGLNANEYELIPGWDFSVDAGPDGTPSTGDDVTGITDADAFIIGRGWDGAAYTGPVMDVAAYTGFVPAAN